MAAEVEKKGRLQSQSECVSIQSYVIQQDFKMRKLAFHEMKQVAGAANFEQDFTTAMALFGGGMAGLAIRESLGLQKHFSNCLDQAFLVQGRYTLPLAALSAATTPAMYFAGRTLLASFFSDE